MKSSARRGGKPHEPITNNKKVYFYKIKEIKKRKIKLCAL